jgi:hypothetical protein
LLVKWEVELEEEDKFRSNWSELKLGVQTRNVLPLVERRR